MLFRNSFYHLKKKCHCWKKSHPWVDEIEVSQKDANAQLAEKWGKKQRQTRITGE